MCNGENLTPKPRIIDSIMRSINGKAVARKYLEVQYSCTCQHIRTLHITICCEGAIIPNILRHTQYIMLTCRKLSLANGTIYVLYCNQVIQ
jgi:hypothetical protein